MIGRVYRLMDTKRVEMVQREVLAAAGDVLVKPEYMAICAADRRYYFGKRKKEILAKKLPMALVHEATAIVLYDYGGVLPAGSKAVLIPLDEEAGNYEKAKANYRPGSKFASSGLDGFMRDVISLPRDRLLPVTGEYSVVYVFAEILSVAIGAIQAFEEVRRVPRNALAVWGDGAMGFVMSLALRCVYPDAKVYVFGKSARKLQKFSFATKTFYIDQIPDELWIDHCFECVGDTGSELAIAQMTHIAAPQATISLLGVSDDAVAVNTRKILEKGLRLVGSNRSDKEDFRKAVAMISENEMCRRYLGILVSEMVDVKNENDIPKAFEHDVLNDFKTVIKWSI